MLFPPLGKNVMDYIFNPKIEKLSRGNNVIFINRLDYLLSKNNFKDIMEFLTKLNEFIYIQKWILIISIDSKTLKVAENTTQDKCSNVKYDASTFYNTTTFYGNSFSVDEEKILITSDKTGIFNVYSQSIKESKLFYITFFNSSKTLRHPETAAN